MVDAIKSWSFDQYIIMKSKNESGESAISQGMIKQARENSEDA